MKPKPWTLEPDCMEHPPNRSSAANIGLSFLNSAPSASGGAARDQLEDGAGLLAWLDRAGAAPEADVARRWRKSHADELDSVAARARSLREWFRGFVGANLGRSLGPADVRKLRRLNSLVRGGRRYYQIVPAGSGDMPFRLRFSTPWSSPESVLTRIAEALAAFVCEVDFRRIRICEGASCSLIFVDRSRARARRWCSMAKCGNRYKQASLRGRAKPEAERVRAPSKRAMAPR
jgi:predicted RNA-binding Zn ribbon-like protein